MLLARKHGLSHLSFTDHDMVEGLPEAIALGCEPGGTVIPGVEISAWDARRGRKAHILGYGFGLDMSYVDAFDAVRAVIADGGIAVPAHHGEYESWDLVPELVAAGLGGIEYLHESHSTEDHRKVLALSKRFGLLLADGEGWTGEVHADCRFCWTRRP